MRISDWSSDVCSSDLVPLARANNHRGKGDFRLAADGRITGRRGRNRVAPFVFTGIQILSPRLLVDAPEGPFSTNLFWDRAIAAERAYGLVHQEIGRASCRERVCQYV